MAIIAFVAFAAAGVEATWQAAAVRDASAGAFGLPAQLLSGIALAAVLSTLVAGARPSSGQVVGWLTEAP